MSSPPLKKRSGTLLGLLVIVLVLLALVASVAVDWFWSEPPEALAQATYVGRDSCAACHQEATQEYIGSHHDRAMELATEASVLGDFNDTVFERLGVKTRFFRKGEQYFVNTEGPDGEYHDYHVKYTFGFDPLQQYMVEFPDGRVQVLRVSWDTHRKKWFNVPPPDAIDERLAPDDPTHWTGIAQNWNNTCAECHSTNLQKNYDFANDSYHTTFSEIDVSCEACHGPASLHVKLAESRSLFWDREHEYGLDKIRSVSNIPQIESCAKCHSRRGEVHPHFRPGKPFANHYKVTLLENGLYHPDGQILDEVYVYGSFLQSRMHAEGVRCSDCHNPHSLKLKADGNQLCAKCHVPAKYDTVAHHHHKANTPGASCVECHMPETTYMVVDPRRDHSIRVPRPDLTVSLGTPNACNGCHTKPEESSQWAADAVVEWYGPDRKDDVFGGFSAPAFAAGRERLPEAEAMLLKVVSREQIPAITRATAYSLLGQYNSPAVRIAFLKALEDDSPLVRRAAVTGLPGINPKSYIQEMAPMLDDPIRTVRIAAAIQLLPIDPNLLSNKQKETLEAVTEEHRQSLAMVAEHAGAHLQLSMLARRANKPVEAEKELRAAIRLEPYLSGIRPGLAQMLDAQGGHAKEVVQLRSEEVKLLERDITLLPQSPDVRYHLGIMHYLLEDLDQAGVRLNEAHQMEPRSYQFALGIALLHKERYKRGIEEAFEPTVLALRELAKLAPQSQDARALQQELLQMRKARDAQKP